VLDSLLASCSCSFSTSSMHALLYLPPCCICIAYALHCTAGRAGPSAGLEAALLPRMLRFTIRQYFPELWEAHNGDALASSHPAGNEAAWHPLYAAWLAEVRAGLVGWLAVAQQQWAICRVLAI
jgi:hypothetical protein